METAKFKKNAGPISAEIKSGYAQPGSYTLYLWEANINKIVLEKNGNFINSDDDKYEMPLPNEANDKRIVDVFITLVITPPITDYNVELEITQEGNIIGNDSQTGQSSDKTKTLKLIVVLEEEE